MAKLVRTVYRTGAEGSEQPRPIRHELDLFSVALCRKSARTRQFVKRYDFYGGHYEPSAVVSQPVITGLGVLPNPPLCTLLLAVLIRRILVSARPDRLRRYVRSLGYLNEAASSI